ncbi:hypothetical protein HPB48_022172 [Haemaphysalis longicornis]|uniref:THAP-type domain-containing protein n=1 Tax=Haemaphysalis longicornis TaxID=44386 RepID=A0A9J6GL91_HAELO|nr:hypothetical protein HPB48_022172 [Haemaphysalis longicornis]
MNLVEPSSVSVSSGNDAIRERTAPRSHVRCLSQGGLGCGVMPTCCAVGCSSSIAKGGKLFVAPRGENDTERRAVWLHRIGRENFDCHRGRLCEVSSHYKTFSRRHASGRLLDEARLGTDIQVKQKKSSLMFPSTLSPTISTTMTARSCLARSYWIGYSKTATI